MNGDIPDGGCGGKRGTRSLAMMAVLLSATSGGAAHAQHYAPERWAAHDHATIAILGNITFSPERVIFSNRKSLPLARLGGGQVRDQDSGQTVAVDLFRVPKPANPVLAGGNSVCGGPVTFLAVWKPAGEFGPDRKVEFYDSKTPPTPTDTPCSVFGFDVPVRR